MQSRDFIHCLKVAFVRKICNCFYFTLRKLTRIFVQNHQIMRGVLFICDPNGGNAEVLVYILNGNLLVKIILQRINTIVLYALPERRKGAPLCHQTRRVKGMRNRRAQRTEDQIQQDNTDVRVRMAQLHQTESEDAQAERNEQRKLEQRQARRFIVSRRRANDQQRQQVHRAFTANSFLRLAFEYEPDIQY